MIPEFHADRANLEQEWRKGGDGPALLKGYSALADSFIVSCFDKISVPDKQTNIALVAIGGYGRSELFPRSDIDLMILYRPDCDEVKAVADGVLYPLWDTGVEIGHGVRTIAESVEQAQEDYFFRVALLDARYLCGSRELFQELKEVYQNRFVEGCREEFVVEMKAYRKARRVRFGTHSYLLEPNIKEGRGGVRDIQAMFWTAKVVFGLNGLDDLYGAGLLLEEEKNDFLQAWDMLSRLRNYLHCQSKRKNDQLYFEQQEDIAEAFGYTNREASLAVESFMREVYKCLQDVAVITDLFFDHVDEVLGLVGNGAGAGADRVVEKGIEILKGKVHLTARAAQLRSKPHILIRLFLVMARTGLPLHHRTRKLIPGNLHLVTDKVRSSPRLTKTFFNILLEADDVFAVLETMLETGVLPACIPEFAKIITLAQHDVYHIYTVDRHSLQTVGELKKLLIDMPQVVSNVKSLRVLFFGALLHDIGKGSGLDHSIEGRDIVMKIGICFGLSAAECESLGFLVRYHLFIPENAMRRDLNDALFIKRCAETIGDLDRLSLLYLVSVADSKATGPSAWSEWKGALMEEMYLKIYSHLDFGYKGAIDGGQGVEHLEHEEQVEQGVEWLRGKVVGLLRDERDERDVMIDVASLSADYLLSFSPEKIVSHVVSHRDNYKLLRQKSLVSASEDENGWSLLIMAVDRPGLLAKICGVMALNNLAVIRAQIFTWEEGTAVDVLNVKATDGLGFAEKDWGQLTEDLDRAISHRLGLSHRLYRKMSSGRRMRRELAGEVDTKVVIDNKSSDAYSVVEVYSSDLPGQLYRITQTLADFGMNIHKAYIATEVGQLIDVFYVLDSCGEKLIDDEFRQEVTHGLLYSVGLAIK